MTQKIGTFYVVDFDRCLGNIEASFGILKEVAHELSIVDRQVFKTIREKTESTGVTFSALEYIKANYPMVDLDIIEKMYIQRARLEPDSLLETGAKDLIDFFHRTNRNFCIMSFGDNRWQSIKINGSGITGIPVVIVPKSQKGNYIKKWQDPSSGQFIIPKSCFLDNKSKTAKEVVLIDDKAIAFKDLPIGARGYLVTGSSNERNKPLNINKMPAIKQIKWVNEIIGYESRL
jgi:hypothetical protein